ncbi:MAG: hypothetical protein WC831_06030 [Parcubacteria group bacterium]
MIRDKILFSLSVIVLGMFFLPAVSRGASAPKEPTVEDCVEHMGFSEEKCTEMIEKFKNTTPEDRAKMRPQGSSGDGAGRPPGSGNNESARPSEGKPPEERNSDLGNTVEIETQIENTKSMKSAREEKFLQMEKRMEKIVEYLKSQNVDTSEAESNIITFKEKATNILSTYDAYIAALGDSRDNNGGKLTDAAREVREKIRELSSDLKEFFRNTLLVKLRSQIDQLAE